jgi:hypothetical protein
VYLPEGGECQPQEEDELEDKVEGEPVDNADEALNDGEESEDDPVLKYVSESDSNHKRVQIVRTVSHWVSSAVLEVKRAPSE